MLYTGSALGSESPSVYIEDALGSARSVATKTGTRIWSATYAAYGAAHVDADPDHDTATYQLDRRGAGQEAGDLEGVYYNGRRFLDTANGRYISADPVATWGSAGLYKFALNNPNRFNDPTGTTASDWADKADSWINAVKESAQSGDPSAWVWDASVETAADILKGITDSLRFGEGFAAALEPCLSPWDRTKFAFADTLRGASLAAGLSGAAGLIGRGGAAAEAEVAAEAAPYGATPKGRPLTRHYATETGPQRNIPGSVVDETIDNYPGKSAGGGKTVHYDPNNNVTVVTGDGQSIVSARKGQPPSSQR
jgi:RHS repeat-associated protein